MALQDNLSTGLPELTDPLAGRDLDKEGAKLADMGLDKAAMASIDPLKLFEATYSQEELAGIPGYQKLKGITGEFGQAQETLLGTPQPTNSMLRILENGLRAKSGVDKQPLGTSELFGAAGLSGYAVLSQSLAERSKEMGNKYTNFVNMMQTTSESLTDSWNTSVKNYEILKDDYDTQMDRMNDIMDGIIDHERAMEMLIKESDLDKEYLALSESYKGSSPVTGSFGDGYASVYGGGSWDSPSVEALSGLFIPEARRDMDKDGWWCGQAYNDFTDGGKVGDAYSTKMALVTKQNNPQMGNGLITPWGGTTWGHAGVVLDYDEATGTVYTVEYNHDGDGKQTFEQYTIDDLNAEWGDNWGFTDSTLKEKYKGLADDAKANEAGTKDWLVEMVSLYKKGATTSQIHTKISNKFADTTTAKYYRSLFDDLIVTPEIVDVHVSDLPFIMGNILEKKLGKDFVLGTKEGKSPFEQVQEDGGKGSAPDIDSF
jgi:hypothetical protein